MAKHDAVRGPTVRRPLESRAPGRTVAKRAATPAETILGLQRSAGNAATASWFIPLQRDLRRGPVMSAPTQDLGLPGVVGDLIAGPLPPGTVRQSGGLTVTQRDAQHVEIGYGASTVRLSASPGDVYAFSVGPPIEGPPKPSPALGPLIELPGPDAKPDLPQRLVRVSSTASIVEQELDATARVAPLAVQSRITSATEVRDTHPEIPTMIEVIESGDKNHAQLQLEESMIQIDGGPDSGGAPDGTDAQGSHATFAYWIDPEWTGPHADQRRVMVVAAPGVRVTTGTPAHAPIVVYGRSLTLDVVRVPHRALVPEQGTRFSLEEFVGVETIDPRAQESSATFPGLGPAPDASERSDAINVGTGLAGVSIVHPWSGARVSLRPADAAVGAAYAWQVVAPMNGQPGEIRAVVGPGVTVSVAEPVPHRLRDPEGATPTPKAGQADTGDGLAEQSFEFKLIEVFDASRVPVQGTPLNTDYLLGFGAFRQPDQHAWLDTNDAPYRMATAGFDMVVSLIPIVGPLYLIGEFTYAIAAGHDWWGNNDDDGGKVLMGVNAALGLIPLVGGVRALLTGAAEASKIAEFAARWGISAEELQTVLARVSTSVTGDDAALVQRAIRAVEQGSGLSEEELGSLRSVLGKLGAGGVALEGLALTATGKLELALASGGTSLRSENYLGQLLSEVRTTGRVSDELIAPLVRSGHFGNAEEAEMAVRQALRDLARAEGVTADEALVNTTAHLSGEALARAQSAAGDLIAPQTRTLAASQPELVARYEQLVNQRLPAVINDVLAAQSSTPGRVRLAQIRHQVDQLRAQVGDAERLTAQERDLANQLLREARDLARADFKNVQKAIWRRLRNPTGNPDLAQIEQRLRAAGDVSGPRTGALRVKMAGTETGATTYESMNLEHRMRLSDNPWAYNEAGNLLLSDSAQNQQYLEAIRQYGSVWPTDPMEDFVVRFRLNDQAIDFAPQAR